MVNFINVVIAPLDSPLTYEVPEALNKSIEVGFRVSVPLGKRQALGFVVSKNAPSQNHTYAIKQIHSATHSEPCFLPGQLEFFNWVADYYGEPLANVIDVAVPPSVPAKVERYARLIDGNAPLKGKIQQQIVEHLKQCQEIVNIATLSRLFKGSAAALKTLTAKNIISIESNEILSSRSTEAPEWAKRDVTLSHSQYEALHKITDAAHARRFETFLLHGVTGSGKTEVYIEAIKAVIAKGLGALVIVPEIALTPQLVERFQARLGDDIAVLHSGLHKRIRWDSWRSLIRKEKCIAIGARSAVFSPVENLGLIIVDEEHDGSYKQNEGLRYNARDLAVVRGKFSNCPVVLGSATPSLESFHNVRQKKFQLLELSSRHESGSPVSVEIVDLNKLKPWEMPSRNISPRLHGVIKEALEKREQIFLLYNRRGFANYLQCDTCEEVLLCPNCSVSLTYHQFNNSLVCHYCHLTMATPTLCTSCTKSGKIAPGAYQLRGSGTEKTQEEVQALFPEASVARLDRDVVSDIETYEAVLNGVRSGKIDILVGTQMIAKGHDLPGVTVAAVIDCDVGLHMPDFRAGEKVYQLLTQLSGRAGRGDKEGLVILQTRVPRHPSLVYTVKKDYIGFAQQELATRSELQYPPFSRLLRIVASSSEEKDVTTLLEHLAKLIRQYDEIHGLGLSLLGPAPCPLSRLKNEWRWHILLKSKRSQGLVSLLTLLKDKMPRLKKIKVLYDLDPHDML